MRAAHLMVIAALTATACASTAPTGSTPRRKLNIVAAENFWGSIVSELAGRTANVTSVVSDPNADPHSYESSANDARAFGDADYVVVNGAGYDGWADKLLAGNPSSKRKILSVAGLLGKKQGDNPHFWYDPDFVSRVVVQVEADLKVLDPTDSAYFDAQRASLDSGSAGYRRRLAAMRATFAGTPVAATESIFVYLSPYLGLNLISPPEFMNAVAEGNDPPAPAVAAFQDQLRSRRAKVLVYNAQTSTQVTTNLRKLAVESGIATVGVTETIQPSSASFETWFDAQLSLLDRALAGSASGPGVPSS